MFYGQTEKLISSIFHIYLRPEIKLSFLGLQIGHSLGVGACWEVGGAFNIYCHIDSPFYNGDNVEI